MGKFHVNYQGRVDIETTEQKARNLGFRTRKGGGRPGKVALSGSSEAQLTIEFENLKTTVQVGRFIVQVYYEDFELLEKVESRLREVIVPLPGQTVCFDKETRVHVPTIRELQERQKLILEILKLEEEFERKTRLKETICSTETVIGLFEDQERVLGFDNKKRIQELKELVAEARGELRGNA